MYPIQWIVFLFSFYAATRALLRYRKKTIGLAEFVVFLFFWVGTGILVMLPGLTQLLARVLGVGRGADAVFYLSIVGLSYAFFRLYLKIRHTEQNITELVRKLALERYERERGN